jgi:hypothetical protein
MNTSSSLLITSYTLNFSHYSLFVPLLFRGINPHAEFDRLFPCSQILISFPHTRLPYYLIAPSFVFFSIRGTNTSASSPKFHALWNLREAGMGVVPPSFLGTTTCITMTLPSGFLIRNLPTRQLGRIGRGGSQKTRKRAFLVIFL